MPSSAIQDAITSLEKANLELDPELMGAAEARELLSHYGRAEKLVAYGKTMLARRVDDASEVAQATGTSMGKAKATLEAAEALSSADQVRDALKGGRVSLDQAAEIAKAEKASPGSGDELLEVAARESFHVLRERARKVVLESEQQRGLAQRQHAARLARSSRDELGMVHLHLAWEPHVGTPIVNRAQAEAARLYREAKSKGAVEPFERHLADAYAGLLGGRATARARRPELVVLVSHEVAKRGWKEVREGEVCKIPGVGPVSPRVAREIAADAFLTGVIYDGKDLRHMRRWSRRPSPEVLLALELGPPPGFDGIACVDCGNRFRNENDHVEPTAAAGPRRSTTSSRAAGGATRPRPSGIAGRAS